MKVLGCRLQVSEVVALALCWFASSAFSETLNLEPKTSPAPSPFLWKIEAPGTAPSYLFGTIHLSRPEVTRMPESVITALDAADAVYTEIPMDPATLAGLTTKFLLPHGQTLADLLPPELHDQLATELEIIQPGLPVNPLERFQVWATTVALATLEEELNNPGALPLDMLLFQRAAIAGKKAGGLETPDEQIAIFTDLSEADQLVFLRDTLTQLRLAREQGLNHTDQLVAAYRSGDLVHLESEMNRLMELGKSDLTERLMARLLGHRNQLMASRITEKIRTNPQTRYFFAVGAAHLYGPEGLISLLEKSNFTLTR